MNSDKILYQAIGCFLLRKDQGARISTKRTAITTRNTSPSRVVLLRTLKSRKTNRSGSIQARPTGRLPLSKINFRQLSPVYAGWEKSSAHSMFKKRLEYMKCLSIGTTTGT